MADFLFKEQWLRKARKTLGDGDTAQLIVLITEYGIYGYHETPLSPSVIPFLDKAKKDIDTQRAKAAKKEKTPVPPTLDEVVQYISDNRLNVDPYQFWNFYNSKDWYVGKNKMKNWHSAIATWVRRNNIQYGQQQSELINKVNDILAE